MTDFEQIYRTYFNDVYRYLLRMCRDPALAEDITSDTFFRAMRALPKFRGECNIRVWLCQIAKNCLFSRLRQQKTTTDIDGLPLTDAAPPPEERAVLRSDIDRISSLLHRLPDPYKEVFMWRVFGELSFRQIGDLFHKNANWACVTYHRARAMIRAEMEEPNDAQ